MLQTDKRALIQLAVKLANNVTKEYEGRWCFFAGFAFVLNGVEKNTYDIDVLAKDHSAYKYILGLLPQIGLQLVSSTTDFSTFRVGTIDPGSTKDLTLDLLCISSEFLKPLKDMWTSLEEKKIDGSTLPVPSPVHLILLKMLVNSHRQPDDRKKHLDLVDVKQLMSIRSITSKKVKEEAGIQGMESIANGFLERLSELTMNPNSKGTTAPVMLRKMVEADIEAVSDLAMLANPFANKEKYRNFIRSQIKEFPELTVVAVPENEKHVIGYFTADTKGDEACIEDIVVEPSWQKKGVGRLLFNESIRLLEKRKMRLLKVEVHYKCSSAIPFYYSFGFRFAACERDRFGKGEDAVILTRSIP